MLNRMLLAITSCLTPLIASAGDEWFVGRDVPSKQRISLDRIDHSRWDALLKQYVDSNGMVDYASWKTSGLDRLTAYLDELSRADLDKNASRSARFAFWINAYNAVTIRGILREYPTTSIRNHTAKLWGYNIWKQLFLKVDGKTYNLDTIEHEILRPMDDPRIHFAIVCASIGCPRLLNEAYTAEELDEQLRSNAIDFFSREQNFQVDGDHVSLSSILDWFGTDFGRNQASQLKRISRWVPERHQALLQSGSASVSYLDYNWQLNKQ